MFFTSPIEQFEIFFLYFPVLSNTQQWLESGAFVLYDYVEGGFPAWYYLEGEIFPVFYYAGIGRLSGNVVWLWMISSFFLLGFSEFEDVGGMTLVYYVPLFLFSILYLFPPSLPLFFAIFGLSQEIIKTFFPHNTVAYHQSIWSDDLHFKKKFQWWNFEFLSLFPLVFVVIMLVLPLRITNALIFMGLIFFFMGVFLFFWMPHQSFFSSFYRWVFLGVLGAFKEQDIDSRNYKYGLFLFPIFWIILLSNIIGLLPYNFTLTSHICFTFTISMSFFIGINLVGLGLNRGNLLLLFLPGSAPPAISVFLIFIETLSYLARMLSLAIRLFANVVAGHILLKILSSFLLGSFLLGGLVNIAIALVIQSFFFLETGVAFLQAYIFFTLCVIYLKDVVSDTTHH